jgi:hypothetical protein
MAKLFTKAIGIWVSLVIFSGCGKYSGLNPYRKSSDDPDLEKNSFFLDQFARHSPKGWKSEPVNIFLDERMDEVQVKAAKNVMSYFNDIVGRDLVIIAGSTPSLAVDNGLFDSLDDDVFGIYLRDKWEVTGKFSVVLGTTVWQNDESDFKLIKTADIHLNSDCYNITDAMLDFSTSDEREIVDFETLLLHEMGHALGLSHIPASVDRNSAMSPTVFIGRGLQNRSYSESDKALLRNIYNNENIPAEIAEKFTQNEQVFPGEPVSDPTPSPVREGCS